MEGMFLRKKFNIWLFLLFACGLFFIGLYIFLNIVDPGVTSELLTFLIMGILIILVVIPSWLLNFGAFIHIDEDSIKAKYHWFGKIDCKLSDVTFAVARVNTLIIQLKDGKTHTIMGVENSWPLASMIRRNMSFGVTEQPEVLMEKLNTLKSAKKKGLIYVCCGLVLMFINIFITVFLTGEREMHEFSKIDWIIFAVMCVVEFATVVITFYFANKTGKKNVPIEKLKYDIRRSIIETKPLVFGCILKVYTDYDCTGRIVVFGYPNDETVYYIMQEFASDYSLFKSYESEIYENMDELLVDIGELIDITDKFNLKTAE
ncbi:MAG: hypothetical protein PUJ07_05435 [Eubacteriales bacterium]|nr:hypothetical protein [Eubacteriales bacterium]MDY2677414.1 hypothetical protein [Oscillospiraceae bacterium]